MCHPWVQDRGPWQLAKPIEYKIDTQKKETLLDLTSRNIDEGQVAPEMLVDVGWGYSSNGRELILEAYIADGMGITLLHNTG